MELACDRCGRSSYVPDDLVQGRAFRARCPDCSAAIEIPAERPSALDDGDLAWLASDARPAAARPRPEPKPEVTERTVAAFERKAGAQRRRHGLVVVAGALVAAAAAAGVLLFISARMGEKAAAARRAREEGSPDASATYDASGLLAKPAPDPAPARAAPPARALGVERKDGPRLRRDDRKLLDLLAKKEDVTVVAPEGDSLDSAQSALDPTAVERTMAGSRKAFDACVSRALRLNPNLRVARRATLVVTVQPNGSVTGAFIAEEEVDRTDLGGCLSAAARRMVFPAFEGDAIDVSMPLSLSAAF